MNTVESILTNVGLYTPTRRFLGFAGISAVVLYSLKPGAMFEDGFARPWTLLGGGDDETIPGTSLPWWLLPLIIGAMAAMFL